MRSGGSAVNQALDAEAAAVVKQAAALAKRRGHAQVTPLHVATSMLAVSGGLLRAACMQSHSHPLQCKALELCFNVALNRLPASSSGPFLGRHPQHPSVSNALIAAFKRAQAHHRRGSAETNPQPQLKIELEQLIISILDDPSVSRVMREAGFSSPQVKTNVEKVVSLDQPSKISKHKETRVLVLNPSSSPNSNPKLIDGTKCKSGIPIPPFPNPRFTEAFHQTDDAQTVINTLTAPTSKKRSIIIVGEIIADLETTIKEVINRIDKGSVPDSLSEVKFITIPPFYSFCNLHRHFVEQKVCELAYLVKSLLGRGVVLYVGDLHWISEYRVNEQDRSFYCPVEHMVMEIGKLISEIGENGRFWVMGIATLQTYMRCRNGYNSLEMIWRLNPVTVPANSLGLSLISNHSDENTRGIENNGSCKEFLTNGEVKLSCCTDCTSKFEAEAERLRNEPTLSSLPPWLKDESKKEKCSDSVMELSKKWNLHCSSTHKQHYKSLERTITTSSLSPSSSTSCFSFDQQNPNYLHLSMSKTINSHSNPCSLTSDDVINTGLFNAGEEEEEEEMGRVSLDLNICVGDSGSGRGGSSSVNEQPVDYLGINI